MKNRKLIILGLLAFVALLAFNLTRRPLKFIEDAAFTNWASKVEPTLGTAVGEELPNVSIRIALPAMGKNPAVKWHMASSDFVGDSSADSREKFLRIFGMLKEANLFGLNQSTESKDAVIVEVLTPEKEFHSSFFPSAVSSNIQAQNLLKLIELYSMSTPTPAPVDPGRL